MKISIIDPLNNVRWLNFIKESKNSDIFNHPAWLNVLVKQYKYKTFAVVIEDDEGNIISGIPFVEINSIFSYRKWVSLPFSDHCTPLVNSAEEMTAISEFLIQKSKEEGIKTINISSHIENNIFKNELIGTQHIISLIEDESKMFENLERNKRQGVNKAIQNGLTEEISRDNETLERFYLLHLKTRRKLGLPVQPKNFFNYIFENLISKDLGFIITIKKGNNNIAAGLFLEFNKKLIYKYNASDPSYLEFRPNNLIIWSAIKYAVNNNFNNFNFGRTDIDNSGLRDFKKGWGAEEQMLYYANYPINVEAKRTMILEKKLLYPFIRYSPLMVCKIAGEILYKFLPSL